MSTEMMLWWIVDDDGQPKGPVGMTEYCAWHADPIARERLRVARDAVGDVEVSTVQLSLDHNYVNYGPPILVESMIFGGEHDLWCRRYATRDAARAGHARIVANLSAGHAPEGADQ